ncbi:gamma-butyrobetaine hydroxylase-like domain-containing protein [Rheinheimera marina]|uniref:Gamma-butyrobetaine hydroxylase-like domain-containing protein n=1 Tax=Rheinheimera marina TaxID=1774958 RepID=A0ABV9JMM9_9GAMM
MSQAPAHAVVTRLHYHRQSKTLDLQFSDGQQFSLPAELLRVFSPSAEVRGHGQATLVLHKKQVGIQSIVPVGHYAVKLVFDDGHYTGLYSWAYLRELAGQQQQLWQQYLTQVKQANGSRDDQIAVKFIP